MENDFTKRLEDVYKMELEKENERPKHIDNLIKKLEDEKVLSKLFDIKK